MCIFHGNDIFRGGKRGLGNREANHNRNARARAQAKREVTQEKETAAETTQSQKERKKETVRQGKAGEQSEKCQEKANGPSARDSVASRSQTRPHISMVILESVRF